MVAARRKQQRSELNGGRTSSILHTQLLKEDGMLWFAITVDLDEFVGLIGKRKRERQTLCFLDWLKKLLEQVRSEEVGAVKRKKIMTMVPAKEGASMSYHMPVLTPINYSVWAVKVKSIMDAYGLWETVEPRNLGEEPDLKKKKQALAFLFQAIPEEMVLQMSDYTDPKRVWEGLKTRYLGVDRRELESLRMKEGETVDDFAAKLSGLASKARSLGHEPEEVDLVKRLLDSMPKSFLQIVASIEQCFELDTMLFDEAVGRLKAYEERIKGSEKVEDIHGGLYLSREEKSDGCMHCGSGGSHRDGFGRGRGRGRGSGRSQDGKERVRDKSHVKCYKCGEFGHYNNECPKWENEANLITEEEPTLIQIPFIMMGGHKTHEMQLSRLFVQEKSNIGLKLQLIGCNHPKLELTASATLKHKSSSIEGTEKVILVKCIDDYPMTKISFPRIDQFGHLFNTYYKTPEYQFHGISQAIVQHDGYGITTNGMVYTYDLSFQLNTFVAAIDITCTRY
ncbi:hypothetical protein LXL04_021535 [Taraxacum kok-saghyz]